MNYGTATDQAQAAREPRASSSGAAAPRLLIGLLAVASLLFVAALYAIARAPVEQQMGVVQKIFYFHFPTWLAMYVGFITCAVCSAVYLKNRDDRWDAVAVSAAEIGMVFCVIGLVTGPLWARKAWGVWWTWDPRLTTVMLEAMVFLAYLVLRAFGTMGDVEKRFAAGLAIIGVLDIPVIRYSVQRWRGTHPTVVTGKGGGLDPAMKPALYLSIVLFLVLVVALIWVRTRSERLRQRVLALELEAAERGLLEES
jgi:heme exporter protein C